MPKMTDIGGPKELIKYCKSKGIKDTKKFTKLFEQFADKKEPSCIAVSALQKITEQCAGK